MSNGGKISLVTPLIRALLKLSFTKVKAKHSGQLTSPRSVPSAHFYGPCPPIPLAHSTPLDLAYLYSITFLFAELLFLLRPLRSSAHPLSPTIAAVQMFPFQPGLPRPPYFKLQQHYPKSQHFLYTSLLLFFFTALFIICYTYVLPMCMFLVSLPAME